MPTLEELKAQEADIVQQYSVVFDTDQPAAANAVNAARDAWTAGGSLNSGELYSALTAARTNYDAVQAQKQALKDQIREVRAQIAAAPADTVKPNPTPPDPASNTNADGSSNSQQVTDSGKVVQTSTSANGDTTTVITNPDGSTTTEVAVAATTTTATEPATKSTVPNGPAYDDGDPPNLYPGWSLDKGNNPVWVGSDFVEPATAASAASSRQAFTASQAAAGKPPFGASADTPAPATASWGPAKDLRVKLRVPNEYMPSGSPGAGPANILQKNGGILFPYTPQITMDNKADYATTSPLHSNYAQYFFKHGSVGPISLTAKFTVQNEYEGAVLLGVIHLLRGLTKMKWGNDPDAGSPPPVCRLDAYGDAMLYNVPVAITSWRQDLPDNVDYITVGRPGSNNTYGHSLVPSLSTIQITLNIMYSRQEQLAFNLKQWNSGALKYKGYL